jgi:hypothetical protein
LQRLFSVNCVDLAGEDAREVIERRMAALLHRHRIFA